MMQVDAPRELEDGARGDLWPTSITEGKRKSDEQKK